MKKSQDAIVGLVVIIVIVALVIAVAWAKQSDIGGRQRVVIARFRDVGNARVGNAVVIRGVVGGRIQAIELADGGWVNVKMKLDPAVSLPSDPVVLLNEASLFGDWQATVIERSAVPHDTELQRAVAEASGVRGAVPGAALPGIGKLTAVAGQIAGDVASAADRIGTAFDDQAARELRETIRNVASLSSTLRTVVALHSSDLDTLSSQLRSTVLTLNRTAASVELTAGRVDSAATSPELRQLVDNFSIAAAEFRRTAVQVRDLSARLDTTQRRANTLLSRTDSVLVKINAGTGTLGLFVNDPSLFWRADSTFAELRALTADIRANPKRYLSVRIF